MLRTAVRRPKGVLAADAAQVSRMSAIAVQVDVLRTAVTPAIHVVDQSHPVHESDQLPRPVGVQHEKVLTVPLRGILASPARTEATLFLELLVGIPVPVDLDVHLVRFRAGFKFDASGFGKRHFEIAVVSAPRFDRQKRRVHVVPSEPVHHAKEIAHRRFDVRNLGVIEVDPHDDLPVDHIAVLRVFQRDPDVLDAAGSVQFHPRLLAVRRDTTRDTHTI